jgi:hypothetical protein
VSSWRHAYLLPRLSAFGGILPFFLGPENHYWGGGGGEYIPSVGELSSYLPITVHEPVFVAIFPVGVPVSLGAGLKRRVVRPVSNSLSERIVGDRFPEGAKLQLQCSETSGPACC